MSSTSDLTSHNLLHRLPLPIPDLSSAHLLQESKPVPSSKTMPSTLEWFHMSELTSPPVSALPRLVNQRVRLSLWGPSTGPEPTGSCSSSKACPKAYVCSCNPSTGTSSQWKLRGSGKAAGRAGSTQGAELHLKSTALGHVSALKKSLSSRSNRTRSRPYGCIKLFPISLLHRQH